MMLEKFDLHRPKKHSLTLKGHRTSVTLEESFWSAFKEIAIEKNVSINELASQIDSARGIEVGLATAIRLYVLSYLRNKA